jgi:hypothetical protein
MANISGGFPRSMAADKKHDGTERNWGVWPYIDLQNAHSNAPPKRDSCALPNTDPKNTLKESRILLLHLGGGERRGGGDEEGNAELPGEYVQGKTMWFSTFVYIHAF